MGDDAESVARRVLEKHKEELERIGRDLASKINDLKQMDLQAWRHEGRDLVNWMYGEAEDMANAERNVAITKTTGGAAAIAGGVMMGIGVVASFSTFGLAAPLALGGLALSASGAATSAGGDIAKLTIVHMKTCQIRERCQRFEERTEAVLIILLEMRQLMRELSTFCQLNSSNKGVIEIVLKSGKSATSLVMAGIDLYKMAAIVYDITMLQKSGVIFGADFLKLAAGSITGSGLIVSRALFKTAGAAVGIAFGIWDVVDAAGTLQNGGSHTALIRDNASQIHKTIQEIDNALRELDVLTCACCL